MTRITTSYKGILFSNGCPIEDAPLFKPTQKYVDGDLSTVATLQNIFGVCQTMMKLLVKPMGMQLQNWKHGYPTLDVVKKHRDGTLPYKRSKKNLTRGWCYLVSGVLHRFFYKNYDLYKVPCCLDPNKRDYHWWLESKCRNYVIDLTEEQYLKVGVHNIRENGVKTSRLGHSYGMKTRNMSYFVATQLEKYDVVQIDDIQHTKYQK